MIKTELVKSINEVITISNAIEFVYGDAIEGCDRLKINGINKNRWPKANRTKILKRK